MINSSPYFVPACNSVTEQEIKKSRFITYLLHTPTINIAKAMILQTKQQHPQARHHCWAYVAGRPGDPHSLGFSDDGEPSGTAGKPILAQLIGSQLGEICALVVRYYGGIRLGTGGLVKAYGGGVQHGLTQLATVEKLIMTQCLLTCEYSHIKMIEQCLLLAQGVLINTEFSHKVNMTVEIDARQMDVFSNELTQRSKGQITIAALSSH